MPNIPEHRCSDPDCPSFKQRTGPHCRCHKTSMQMLVEQRDLALSVLRDAEEALFDTRAAERTGQAFSTHRRIEAAIKLMEGRS